jgi:hypothetical protein
MIVALLFLIATIAAAQDATLPRKGRQAESGPAPAREPIRKLPRPASPAVTTAPAPQYNRPVPERPLIFAPTPFAEAAVEPIRTLPRGHPHLQSLSLRPP